MKDALLIRSNVEIRVYDHSVKRLVRQWRQHNLVTLSARTLVSDLLAGEPIVDWNGISHIGMGLGNTPVSSNDVALENELFRDVFTSMFRPTAGVQFQFYLSSGVGNGFTLQEMGLFSSSSGPSLFSRVVLAQPIVKTTSVAATIAWTINVGATA